MRTSSRWLSYLVSALLLVGCANIQSTQAPDADLSKLHTFYVQKAPSDDHGIDKLISDRLNAIGYQSTYGTAEAPAQPVDAIVTYEDKWWWDMSMYMLELRIQVRDGSSRAVLANATSHRPSLQRKSPEGMVEEVLDAILKKKPT